MGTKFELVQCITAALKSTPKLVKLQSLAGKCRRIWKIYSFNVGKFVYFSAFVLRAESVTYFINLSKKNVKFLTTVRNSVLELVILQSLVANCCKVWKIQPFKVVHFCTCVNWRRNRLPCMQFSRVIQMYANLQNL